MTVNQRFTEIKEKYHNLVTRQRFMVLGFGAALILVLFDVLWFQSQDKQQKDLKNQISTVEKQYRDLIAANTQRQQELMGASLNTKRKQIESLQQQQLAIDESLGQYAQLVSPREMPELLRQFFNQSKSLKLKSLVKHSAKPAFSSEKEEKQNAAKQEPKTSEATLFKHDVTVTLQGSYFDLVRSLEKLEKMNLKIYWDSIDYQVDKYPNALIKLTVYTYSYEQNWIGA